MNDTMEIKERSIKVGLATDGSNDKKTTKYIIPKTERYTMRSELTDKAQILLMEYIDRSLGVFRGQPLGYEDILMARVLCWTVRKVADARRELLKNHWILIRTYVSQDQFKSKAEILFIGKGAVRNHLESSAQDHILRAVHTEWETEQVPTTPFAKVTR